MYALTLTLLMMSRTKCFTWLRYMLIKSDVVVNLD